MLVINENELRTLVDLESAIESQRDAYVSASRGQMVAEGVLTAFNAENDALIFAVTGAIAGRTGVAFKIGCESPSNSTRGLSTLQSMVVLTDAVTSEVLACLNGAAVTALRTSAGVAAAVDALARREATSLGVFGSGVQARDVTRMISTVRPLVDVRIWSPTAAHRSALVAELSADPVISAVVTAAERPRLAADCDIVVTCTTSRDPVVEGDWLVPGATVLTIGSYAPDRREIDLRTSERAARIFVDDVGKALDWSGPLREAINHQVVDHDEVHPVGAVISGDEAGREREDDILIFHSLGLAIQDAALGCLILDRAKREGMGTAVEL